MALMVPSSCIGGRDHCSWFCCGGPLVGKAPIVFGHGRFSYLGVADGSLREIASRIPPRAFAVGKLAELVGSHFPVGIQHRVYGAGAVFVYVRRVAVNIAARDLEHALVRMV